MRQFTDQCRLQSYRLGSVFATLLLGACSQAAPLPELSGAVPVGEAGQVPGTVTDVYARIARGSRGCWFGPDGVLDERYIFHADVAPESRGGMGEISIHERERELDTPWGRRAFRVQLTPAGASTSIEVENLRMPDDIASRMRGDLLHWAAGKPACSTREGPPLTALDRGAVTAPGKGHQPDAEPTVGGPSPAR